MICFKQWSYQVAQISIIIKSTSKIEINIKTVHVLVIIMNQNNKTLSSVPKLEDKQEFWLKTD